MTDDAANSIDDQDVNLSPVDHDKAQRRVLTARFLIAFFLILLLVSFWMSQKVPYYSFAPGPTQGANSLVVIPAAQRHAHKGQIYFTTVSQSNGRILRFQYFWGKLFDHDIDFQNAKQIENGNRQIINQTCLTPNQFDAESWSDSEKTAVSIALRRLNKTVHIPEDGALIAGLRTNSPSEGKLKPCDEIIAIDNQPTKSRDEVISLVRKHKPGESVSVTVKAIGSSVERKAEIVTTANQEGQAQLGVVVTPKTVNVASDPSVRFKNADIGGPSAGLAFALDVLNSLSASDLTGGHQIAITGEIHDNGTVGGLEGFAKRHFRFPIKEFIYFWFPPIT